MAPVSSVCPFNFGFAVGPAVPASVRGIKDFLSWCKENPGKADFGSPASGSTPHLLGNWMGGQVSGYTSTVGSFLPHLKSGRVRLIAVSGIGRNHFVPEVPTYREQGYSITSMESYGLFLPGKAPQTVVRRAAAHLQPLLATAGYRERSRGRRHDDAVEHAAGPVRSVESGHRGVAPIDQANRLYGGVLTHAWDGHPARSSSCRPLASCPSIGGRSG